jgi:hypothetical protein
MKNDIRFIPTHGNYQDLLSYRKAEIVYDLTFRTNSFPDPLIRPHGPPRKTRKRRAGSNRYEYLCAVTDELQRPLPVPHPEPDFGLKTVKLKFSAL